MISSDGSDDEPGRARGDCSPLLSGRQWNGWAKFVVGVILQSKLFRDLRDAICGPSRCLPSTRIDCPRLGSKKVEPDVLE